jgi:hypothetical protein
MSKLGPVVEVALILTIVFLGLWFISSKMSFGGLLAVGLFSAWVVLVLEHWASGRTRDDEELLAHQDEKNADLDSGIVKKLREIPRKDAS